MPKPQIGKTKWGWQINKAQQAIKSAREALSSLNRKTAVGPQEQASLYTVIALALGDIQEALVELGDIGDGGSNGAEPKE